jgi:predicted RNA-binding Zn ribbon-like protein
MSDEFSYIGGLPCLDFANAKNRVRRWLEAGDFDELVDWSLEAGTIGEKSAARMRAAAACSAEGAGRTLERAARLSDLLCRFFGAVGEGDRPPDADLEALNSELAEAMSHTRVVASAEAFEWGWSGEESELDSVLWPIVRSAANLLVSDELEHVKICANDECRWVFLDSSRNHSRRWCDMKVCGNRTKVRKFRARSA